MQEFNLSGVILNLSFTSSNNSSDIHKSISEHVSRIPRNVPIRVNYLIRRDNLNQIDYIYDLVKDLGVERLFYILIAPQGKAYQNNELLLTDEERKYYLNLIQKKKAASGDEPFITIQDYATNLHSCFLINSRGDIVSQGYSEDDCIVTGNIFTDGLQKCWNNPAFNHRGHFLQYAYMFDYYM